jgi:hypothetical protein
MKSTGRGQDGKPQRADHAVIEAQCKQIICDHRRLAIMKDAPSFVQAYPAVELFQFRNQNILKFGCSMGGTPS